MAACRRQRLQYPTRSRTARRPHYAPRSQREERVNQPTGRAGVPAHKPERTQTMTNIEIDLADILEQKYPHGFHVPADIDLSLFLEFGDDDWTHDLDLKSLLAHDRRIALVFTTE